MASATILAACLGYLLGSIPFGLLLTRSAGLGDIRAIGSGNIGATNVLRTGNKGLAAATLLLDALKATAAILIAGRWGHDPALAAAAGAFLGHCFPVWLRFQGGKGVATFLGCLLALDPYGLLVAAIVWLAVAGLARYSSAAGLAAPLGAVGYEWIMGDRTTALVLLALAAVLWAKHRANIARLVAGTETRIGQRS